MSGHSKWSTIKHKKAATDARRGKLFTKLLREITVSARLGGGDPRANPRLRAAMLEARSNSVPGDNIERAIKKGTGELAGESYEEFTYEGYGPGGVAMMVEGLTDNRNRTASEVRHLFTRHGGSLGESGCVAWMFKRRGYFALEPRAMDEEAFLELALELGADDVATEGGEFEIFTAVEDYNRVREELERRGVPLATKELAQVPDSTIEVANPAPVLRLIDALEDQDDVQHVWANLEVNESVLAAQEG
ncbi:MAG: YebC/PmpR family DNA-binding transcriptional regulator [Thermoanaerobaculia bacterium]